MENQEKMNLLEEIMELDEGTLKPEDELESYPEWDSITVLSFIALMDEKFHKTISGKEIKEFKTVEDVLKVMEQ